jgi:DNA-binding NarL/FixJ family response regulator
VVSERISVLMNLSGESGVAVASMLLAAHPGTAVVMLSGAMSQDELVAAVEVECRVTS